MSILEELIFVVGINYAIPLRIVYSYYACIVSSWTENSVYELFLILDRAKRVLSLPFSLPQNETKVHAYILRDNRQMFK